LGLAWLAWAWRCDDAYCERHLLPSFHVETPHDHVVTRTWRLLGAGVGVAFLIATPFAARWVRRVGLAEAAAATARIGVALVLSLVVAEIAMRRMNLPRLGGGDGPVPTEVRIGQPDPRYAW